MNAYTEILSFDEKSVFFKQNPSHNYDFLKRVEGQVNYILKCYGWISLYKVIDMLDLVPDVWHEDVFDARGCCCHNAELNYYIQDEIAWWPYVGWRCLRGRTPSITFGLEHPDNEWFCKGVTAYANIHLEAPDVLEKNETGGLYRWLMYN